MQTQTATTEGGCMLGFASANFESVVCYLVPGQYKEICALIDEFMYLLMYSFNQVYIIDLDDISFLLREL